MKRCACNNALLQKAEGGEGLKFRIDGPIVITGDSCMAKCHWCKRAVELPLQLRKGSVAERFLIRR